MYYQGIKSQIVIGVFSLALVSNVSVGNNTGTKDQRTRHVKQSSSVLKDLYNTILDGLQMGAVTKAEVSEQVARTDYDGHFESLEVFHFSEQPEVEFMWAAPGHFLNVKALQTLELLAAQPIMEDVEFEAFLHPTAVLEYDAATLEHFVASHPDAFAELPENSKKEPSGVLDRLNVAYKSAVVMAMTLPSLDIQTKNGSNAVDKISKDSEISSVSVLLIKKGAQMEDIQRAFTKEMLDLKFTQLAKEDGLKIFGKSGQTTQKLVFLYIDLEEQVMLVEVTGAITMEQE